MINISEEPQMGGVDRPQLFASLFLQRVPVVNTPVGYYDPERKLYIDEETKVPMWLGEKTTCERSSGMKNEMCEVCVSRDSQGHCTETIDKMDFSTDYDTVSDQY